MISETHNIDCMEFMSGLPDGFFDLVIADPPYGIGANKMSLGNGKKTVFRGVLDWDRSPMDESFFVELRRVSLNQIVWGANHFIDKMPFRSSCWIFWDKGTGSNDFADGELAWASFDKVVKKFFYSWVGANAKDGLTRQHPTQKPVALYKWLLTNYAKPGQRIFDPMMGSQSSRIAAHDMGFDYWGCELDREYFEQGEARFKAHTAKPTLFAPEQMYQFEQVKLFQD